MNRPVYMDYAAATPLDPRVVKVMIDCLTLEGSFANPSSKDHVFAGKLPRRLKTQGSKWQI